MLAYRAQMVKQALYATAILCLLACSWAAAETAWTVHRARVTFSSQNLNIPGQVKQLLTDADETVKVGHDAAQGQADFYNPKKPGGATQQIYRLFKDTKDLIGRTDISVNGGLDFRGQKIAGVLPQLSATLSSTTALAIGATGNINETSARLQPILADLGTGAAAFAKKSPEILQQIDDAVSDPSIHDSFLHFDQMSIDGAAMTHNGVLMTNDARDYVHRLTRPVRGTVAIAEFILEHGYQVRALVP